MHYHMMNSKMPFFSFTPYKIIFILSLFLSQGIEAQTEGVLRKGEKYFQKYSYTKAIEKYESLTEKTTEVKRMLAESYAKIGDTEKSEGYYASIVTATDKTSEDVYNYASILAMNGKHMESENWMKQYSSLSAHDSRALQYTAQPSFYKTLQKDKGQFIIKNLEMNSSQEDFGPIYYKDKIVFTSSRERTVPIKRFWNWNGLPFLDMYEAIPNDENELSDIKELMKGKKNNKYHEGPVTFNSAGNFMVFTRNNYKGKSEDGVIKLQLFSSKLVGEKWEKEIPLPFNSNEYSVGHASLSSDGKTMFFSSDMPGGKGGVDLYKTMRNEDGTWSKAQNLGDKINTEGNELFPFIHTANEMLYFSSNGHLGLGGLDVFEVDLTASNFEVINLGSPINSNKDDFSFILHNNKEKGYFSSNREGGKGSDDIYSFIKQRVSKIGCPKDCSKNPCVIFDLSESPGFSTELFDYVWDLGDGTIKNGAKIEHCYKEIGTYQVQVSSINKFNKSDKSTVETAEIVIDDISNSTAVIECAKKMYTNELISFSASNSESNEGELIKYLWEFSDGTEYYEEQIEKQFSEEGDITVTLTVGASLAGETCCEDKVTNTITIFPNEADEKKKYLDTNGVIDLSYYDPSELFNLTLIVTDKSNSNVLSNSELVMKDKQGRVWMSKKTNEEGIVEATVSRFIEYEIVATKESYSIKDTLFTTTSLTEEEYSRFYIPLIKGGINIVGLIVDAETGKVIDVSDYSMASGSEQLIEKSVENGKIFYILPMNHTKKKTIQLKANASGYLGGVVDILISSTKSGVIDIGKVALNRLAVGSNLADLININPIYFDVNKAVIRLDAAKELDKIVDVMKKNPELVIELGSHTDSRGTDEANFRLSDKRAKSSAQYIINKGISADNIYGKGYGETKLINRCKNGVKCSRKEHQENRRTEFKIIKM